MRCAISFHKVAAATFSEWVVEGGSCGRGGGRKTLRSSSSVGTVGGLLLGDAAVHDADEDEDEMDDVDKDE